MKSSNSPPNEPLSFLHLDAFEAPVSSSRKKVAACEEVDLDFSKHGKMIRKQAAILFWCYNIAKEQDDFDSMGNAHKALRHLHDPDLYSALGKKAKDEPCSLCERLSWKCVWGPDAKRCAMSVGLGVRKPHLDRLEVRRVKLRSGMVIPGPAEPKGDDSPVNEFSTDEDEDEGEDEHEHEHDKSERGKEKMLKKPTESISRKLRNPKDGTAVEPEDGGCTPELIGIDRVLALAVDNMVQQKLDMVKTELTATLHGIFAQFKANSSNADVILNALNSKMDALDSKMDALDSKVDALDSKVDALDSKVDALDSKVDSLCADGGPVEGMVQTITDERVLTSLVARLVSITRSQGPGPTAASATTAAESGKTAKAATPSRRDGPPSSTTSANMTMPRKTGPSSSTKIGYWPPNKSKKRPDTTKGTGKVKAETPPSAEAAPLKKRAADEYAYGVPKMKKTKTTN